MAMLNTTIIEGRITKTPELRQTPSAVNLCRFSIANETGYGEKKRTNFIDCTAWNKTAEYVVNYVLKGDLLIVKGELIQTKFTTKDGSERTSYELNVTDVYSCGQKREESAAPVEKYTAETAPKFEDVSEDEDLPF